jgi:hypothetical protein
MLGVSKKLLIASSIVLVATSGTTVAHAFQTFTNRAEWEAALSGSPTTFNFSGLAGNSVPSGTVLPNGLSVSYAESVNGGPGFSGFATDTGLSFTRRPIPTSLSLNLGFLSPVQAFGFDLSAGNLLAIRIPSISTQPIFIGGGFFGFLADPGTSLSNVGINCGAISCAGIGRVDVNNISIISSAKAVPEPSTKLALGVLVGVWLALNFKLKKLKLIN